MIDLHTHVLPGLDDGAGDEATALAMCRIAAADGITTLVATPHMYMGAGVNDASVIRNSTERLKQRLAEEHIALDLRCAAEMPLAEDIVERYRSGAWPAYDEHRKYVLLEMPPLRDGLRILCDMLFRLRLEGVRPILAHPERLDLFDETGAVEQVVLQGALLQVSAGSLFSTGSRAAARVQDWLRRGWVHIVASDAHDTVRRPPVLSPARRWLEEAFGPRTADDLTRANPLKILCGQAL